MKLIDADVMTEKRAIEILSRVASYEDLVNYLQDYSVSVQDALLMAIKSLSAIEDIKAEIEESKWTDKDTRIERNTLASGLDKALEIIDKYINGKESK